MPGYRILVKSYFKKRNKFLQSFAGLSMEKENGRIPVYEDMETQNTFLLVTDYDNTPLLDQYLKLNGLKFLPGEILEGQVC